MNIKNKWELSVAPKNYNGCENVIFKSKAIPVQQLEKTLMTHNFSTIHWSGGRDSKNFLKSTGFMIDFDNGFKIEKAEKRLKSLNYNYALITSRSHSPGHHKYHIIIPSQYPIFSEDAYCSMEKEILEKLFPESDQTVKDAARFFYGSPEDADFILNMGAVDYPIIDENIWDNQLSVLDPEAKQIEVSSIEGHTKIYCPFHEDNNPSAFFDYSPKSKNHYIFCSTCNKTFWKREDENPLEDRCLPFWSIGPNIIETGIKNGKFFMEKVGEKKFYILSKTLSF